MHVGGNISLYRYLRHGLPAIPGSCDHTTASLMCLIALHQQEIGVAGDMAEIGVYLGKSFIALANCLRHGEKMIAIDTFESLVADNPDVMGGVGNREKFTHHVAYWAPQVQLEVIEQSSNKLDDSFYTNRIRFFSIDGGHSTALTRNDLVVAERSLAPRGVVLLDDVLNVHWTGVITGLFEYWRDGGTLKPVALIPNKLVLAASEDDAQLYKDYLRQVGVPAQTRKDVELGPYFIDVYEPNQLMELTDSSELVRARVEYERQRTELVVELERRQAGIDQLRGEVDGLRTQADGLRAQADGLRTQVDQILKSQSWKITAPLRAVRGLLG